MLKKLDSNGFHILPILLGVIVIGVIAFVGLRVMNPGSDSPLRVMSSDQEDTGSPIWEYNQDKLEWFVKSGKASECQEPFVLDMSPVDMSKVVAVGLPGAYRGFSYKAHGGFRAANSTAGNLEVKLPIDANLRGVTRYYESIPGYPDEIQYMVDFENDCGIALRFDHLHTLSPELQAVADKTPPPEKNDTRGDPHAERISTPYKAGTVLATTVGFPKASNYGFDFGVYDYRKRNPMSENSQWAEIHKSFSASHYHGVCWLPMLPGNDAALAETMAKDRRNYNSNKPFNLTSDYCTFAPYNSLDFNSGQPTDG